MSRLPPNLARWLTLSDSKYPCLEQVPMVQEIFEPLFDFTCVSKLYAFYVEACMPAHPNNPINDLARIYMKIPEKKNRGHRYNFGAGNAVKTPWFPLPLLWSLLLNKKSSFSEFCFLYNTPLKIMDYPSVYWISPRRIKASSIMQQFEPRVQYNATIWTTPKCFNAQRKQGALMRAFEQSDQNLHWAHFR